MKLRYLRVCNQSPLEDVAINFGHESVLGRNCAIHFVVGVNGSGKSKLLQALAEIFLSLDPNFGNQGVSLPDFPVTLAYDLGKESNTRTIYLRHQGKSPSEAVFIGFKRILDKSEVDDWETLPEQIERIEQTQELEDLPLFSSLSKLSKKDYEKFSGNSMFGSGSTEIYLPKIVLAYTSGATNAWETIFTRLNIEPDALSNVDVDNERPIGWNSYKEQDFQKQLDSPTLKIELEDIATDLEEKVFSQIGVLVKPDDLKLAFCAVALEQSIIEFKEMSTQTEKTQFIENINKSIETRQRMSGLRGILNTVDWLWPITISLRINDQSTQIESYQKDILDTIKGINKEQNPSIATTIVKTPDPRTSSLFVFDLQRPLNKWPDKDKSTANALYQTITRNSSTPFDFFKELYAWKQEGFLEDIQIAFRKRNLKDILLYDWLSDGEQVFLGRMALFHLLKGKDDVLLLLDEPETHFNDLWKREIVDIIDESLGESTCNAVLTTHSSIALTDVFDNEISLLKKSSRDGTVYKVDSPIRSFGASPTEIMRDIFEAPESVGQRAAKFLDLALVLASNPEQSEVLLTLDTNNEDIKNHTDFIHIYHSAKELSHDYGDDDQLKKSLLSMLQSFREYAKKTTSEQTKLINALDFLEDKLGAGYYQLEFRRRLRALRKNHSVPQNKLS